jgi:hypothetical protein
LRYRNEKMRHDATVPFDDELAAMIEAQQARTWQRFPTTGVLLPRSGANPDGRLPIPTATFHLQLGLVDRNMLFNRRTRSASACHRSPVPARSGHLVDQP